MKNCRRHSLPTLSLPRLGSVSPVKQSHFTFDKKKEEMVVEKEEERVGGLEQEQEGEESSNCSTPTMMEPRVRERVRIIMIMIHEKNGHYPEKEISCY